MKKTATYYSKDLLLPVTSILWGAIIYGALYLSILGLMWLLEFHWFWLVLFFVPLITSIVIPLALAYYIYYIPGELYGFSWASVVLHASFGLLGIVACFWILFNTPEMSISYAWEYSWGKTILLFLPFLGAVGGALYVGVLGPFIIREEEK